MCNVLMSVENALIIAKLTNKEKIVFYLSSPLFNSTLSIFDLFDIDFNYSVSNNIIDENITSIPINFHNTCLYYKHKPTDSFLNGRTKMFDLSELEQEENIRTLSNDTLSFYSYLFYIKDNILLKELQDFIKNTIKPKSKYLTKAKDIVSGLEVNYGSFDSIHVRRGDYLSLDYNNNIDIKDLDLSFDNASPITVIHSDELGDIFDLPNTYHLDKDLLGYDNAEKGLISLLVASYSKNFKGTLLSTFTSYIQRYRKYNNLKEDFIYLYKQKDEDFKEQSFGEYKWNRVNNGVFKDSCFWYREWDNCYYNNKTSEITIVPDFLTNFEINKLTSNLQDNEYFQNENRNRTIINKSEVKDLVNKICSKLNLEYNNIEEGIQVFKQLEGGQTFLHTDSVYKNESNKQRTRSVLLYLNEDFKGSVIEFPNLGIAVPAKKGLMISYPLLDEWNRQDIRMAHQTSIITEGYKVMAYLSIME